MIYALGQPGRPIRQFVDQPDTDDITEQLRSGEVAVEVPDYRRGSISADGSTVDVTA